MSGSYDSEITSGVASSSHSHGAHPRPSGGPELAAWIFMRISGIVLLLLALGHLFIMHVFNSVHVIDYDFVARRYLQLFWRGYDLLMLWLAMIHGLNGLRTLFDDYLPERVRGVAVKGVYFVGIAFLILGTWVIIAFQPVVGKGM